MKESKFIEIDYDNWDRKEIFEAYGDYVFFLTYEFDVTRYIEKFKGKIKFYPFMTYITSKVINEHQEFRMAIENGKIGYYDVLHPIYTLLRKNKLFTHKVTDYSEDFEDFYHRFLVDKKIGEECNSLYADGYRPKNTLAISTMPHTSFAGLSFAYNPEGITEFIPFTTFGKYFERDGKWYCPVSIEFYHNVNDGYHAEVFVNAMQHLIDTIDIELGRF